MDKQQKKDLDIGIVKIEKKKNRKTVFCDSGCIICTSGAARNPLGPS